MLPKTPRLFNLGSFALPLCLTLFLMTSFEVGLLHLLSLWKREVRLQLKLDHCIATLSWKLQAIENRIEKTNRLISNVRKAALVSVLKPELLSAFRSSLKALRIYQTSQKLLWFSTKTLTPPKECKPFWKKLFLLPNLSWISLPPDALGPRPWRWPKYKPKKHFLFLWKRNRIASASVHNLKKGSTSWNATWTPPPLPIKLYLKAKSF